MTSIKQLPIISPKNKKASEQIKQDKSKKSDSTFKNTLTSLNAHQELKTKDERITDWKINKNHINFDLKKDEIEQGNIEDISTPNSNREREKEDEKSDIDFENIVEDRFTVLPEQLLSKLEQVNTQIIASPFFDHKPNIDKDYDKIPAKHLTTSSKIDGTEMIPSLMVNEKKTDINTAVSEKKTDINIASSDSKTFMKDSLDLKRPKKIGNAFHLDDLNGIFQKMTMSDLPPKVESTPKKLVIFNNTPITEKEWGSELSRIIKNNIHDINKLEVIIHPRNLGPIKILIEGAKGKNKINIVAKDAYVATLIGEHVNNIHIKLLNSGESVASINVINDSKLNDANPEHQNQSGNREHHEHLDFGFVDNNTETKKDGSKVLKGIFA